MIGGVISGRVVAAFVAARLVPATLLPAPTAAVFHKLLPPLELDVGVAETAGKGGSDDNDKNADVPRSLAGIADPTPLLVKGVGK